MIQRGNNRAACFFGDIDRHFYLNCLAEYARRRACAVHAYALMTNHVHLLVTPAEEGGVSLMLQDIGRRYVRVINEARSRTGTLWEGRFKSNLVDSESYLLACHRYIELNPVRAGIALSPVDYPWTSHSYYALGKPSRVISEHPVFTALGATVEDRRSTFLSLFGKSVEERELTILRAAVNGGWALGSDEFLDRMEETLGRPLRPPRRGRPRKQTDPEVDPPPQAEMLF